MDGKEYRTEPLQSLSDIPVADEQQRHMTPRNRRSECTRRTAGDIVGSRKRVLHSLPILADASLSQADEHRPSILRIPIWLRRQVQYELRKQQMLEKRMTANLGQPVKNKHKVPLKQWNKWSNHARRVFNTMMYSLRPSIQHIFLHPDAIVAKKEHWQTTRWNVAWTAAEAVKGFGMAAGTATKTRWVKRETPKKKVRRRGKRTSR